MNWKLKNWVSHIKNTVFTNYLGIPHKKLILLASPLPAPSSFLFFFKINCKVLALVVHAFNPNIWEALAGNSLWVPGLPGLQIKTVKKKKVISKKRNKTKTKLVVNSNSFSLLYLQDKTSKLFHQTLSLVWNCPSIHKEITQTILELLTLGKMVLPPPFQSFLYCSVRPWFPVRMPWTFPIRLIPCYLDYIIKKKCRFITSKYIKQFN